MDESCECFRPDKGYVARQNQKRRIGVRQCNTRGHHGVTSSTLFVLLNKIGLVYAKFFTYRIRHSIGLMSNNYVDSTRLKRSGGLTNMCYQRTPTQMMKHLCLIRTHSRSQPGCQD
jgi:hypothetical protein